MSDTLPFSLENLSGAAVRPVLLPVDDPSAGVPQKASDIFAQKSPYATAGSWYDVGATAGPAQVSRQITTAGVTIEQSQDTLLEEVTQVVWTVQIPFAELRPQILKLHGAGKIEAIAASANDVASDRVTFGGIEELEHFRVALIVRRKKVQGVVSEGSGGSAVKRGRHLIYVGLDCTLQAENVQTSFGKGQLAQMPITFKLNPIPSLGAGEEHGFWIDEHAGSFGS